jgi:hypothetical protein
LIVIEHDTLLAEPLPKHVVVGPQVLDDLLLLTIDPAGQNDKTQLPGFQDASHG